MSNQQQPNADVAEREDTTQYQQLAVPILRPRVPDWVREQLRRSLSTPPQPAFRQTHPNQQNSRNGFQTPQPNGGVAENEETTQSPQPTIPMLRPRVPDWVRENLRQSLFHQPQPTSQQTQQGGRNGFQRPQPNYQEAFTEMNQTVRSQYAYSQAQIQYAQRQTHIAEYGHPPPNFNPLPRPAVLQPGPLRAPSPAAPFPAHVEVANAASQAVNEAADPAPPAQLSPVAQAEAMAFQLNLRTGLNGFGAPKGYVPANIVDKLPGAWDDGGEMKWVPSWER